MSGVDQTTTARWEELRRSFDESFAAPREAAPQAGERFLSIRMAGEAFALPLGGKSARLSGLAVDRTPVPLPGQPRELLGLVTVNGAILPAFDLAALVGISGARPRWLALVRLPDPAALAFESLDRLIEVSTADLMPMAAVDVDGPHFRLVARLARVDERLLPVLDLDAIAGALKLGKHSRRT